MKGILKIALGVAAGLLLAMGGCFVLMVGGVAAVKSTPSLQLPLKVSMAEYSQLADGMSYRQVASIIGEEGTENASNTMQGIPGVMETTVTKSYSWINANGSNMNAMFQNDKMMMKAQFGLE